MAKANFIAIQTVAPGQKERVIAIQTIADSLKKFGFTAPRNTVRKCADNLISVQNGKLEGVLESEVRDIVNAIIMRDAKTAKKIDSVVFDILSPQQERKRMTPGNMTEQDKLDVIQYYRTHTVNETMRRFNTSNETICEIAFNCGFRKNREWDGDTVLEIIARKQKGERTVDIADEFDTSPQMISNLCRKNPKYLRKTQPIRTEGNLNLDAKIVRAKAYAKSAIDESAMPIVRKGIADQITFEINGLV